VQGKAESEEYGYIHDMITTYPVVVFAKTTCKFCTMAKDVLDQVGVSYCLENIENRDNMAAVQDMFASLTGARTVRHSNNNYHKWRPRLPMLDTVTTTGF